MTSTMNEMASGCCVCSDERGWAENPLVYCDGVGCNIGVHKACYGIVTVPSGNWYCRKCESQERSARVRCELCPSKDGALKRTDNNGWAHVICGLYIPEVRFGSVTTMEPILLSQIPAERFNKVCYICEQNNRGRASVGACMECNKIGCKQQFHVTCAQAMGLLCEEPGNYMDNVKYCGYCQEHYMKIRKNSNVKTIPPYKPVSVANSGSDESPEKKLLNFNPVATDSKQTTKRKSAGSRPAAANGSSRQPSDRKEPHFQQSGEAMNGAHTMSMPPPSVQSHVVKERTLSTNNGSSMNNNCTLPQTMGPNDANCRFTTSNFVESVITPSESVFADVQKNKKRKINDALPPSILDGHCSEQLLPEQLSQMTATSSESPLQECERTIIKPTANQDHDEDNDDDSGDLNFVEEPNLSTLSNKSASSASTSGSANIPSSVISSVTSGTDSSSTSLSTSNSHVINTSTNASTTIKASTASVKSQQNLPTSNAVTSSYLSSSSVVAVETKISKFQNNSNAPHMLGNQLNPTSTMAQKMMDSLNDELKAHSIFTNSDSDTNPNNFVGPPLYNKIISSTRTKESTKRSDSPSNGGPLASLSGSAANFPQTLEELLEKQWEQGGTFLMEQAQHFDIASLLTCLHKLREENLELEEHIRKLKARRDHLLGVNARLAMPLAPITQPVNNSHSSSQTPPQHTSAPTSQSIPHLSLHHHVPHQSQQAPAHQPSLPPSTLQTVPHSQAHYNQSTVNPSMCGSSAGGNGSNLSENSQLRNIPLPPNMSNIYMAPSSANLRNPQNSVYQNQHAIENGLMPHHQHARVMTVMSTSGPMRHHNSTSNPSHYASSQHSQPPPSSNPGVVVRTSNMPEVGRNDRRTSAVMSSY